MSLLQLSDPTIGGNINAYVSSITANSVSADTISCDTPLFAYGSVSGYANATKTVNAVDGGDTPIVNPSNLSQGWWIVALQQPTGSGGQEQVSAIAHYNSTGGIWDIGGCCSSVAGSGRFGLNVASNRSTLVVSNSTGSAFPSTIAYFAKLMN
jgi:hypothetical protein